VAFPPAVRPWSEEFGFRSPLCTRRKSAVHIMLTSFPTVTCAGTRAAAASTMKHPIHVARHFTAPSPFPLQHFHLSRRRSFCPAQTAIARSSSSAIACSANLYVLEFLHASRAVGDEPHYREGLFHLD